jgi:hypothetical protein
MPTSLLESHIHKLLVRAWHGQKLELANTSRDRIEGFERMRRHMADFVAVESIEPYFVTSSYRW